MHGRVGRAKKRYGLISKEATVYSTPGTIYGTILLFELCHLLRLAPWARYQVLAF